MHQSQRARVVGLFLAISFFSPFQLRADETKRNVRELCRLEVASALLQSYNDLLILGQQITLGERKAKEFTLRMAQLQKDLDALTRRPREGLPTPELDQEEHSLRFQLQVLRKQQLETEKDLSQGKTQYANLNKSREAFEALIRPVFTFNPPPADGSSGLPQQIRYRHACGPYHLLCPLPAPENQALKKIAVSLGASQPCERYSGVALPP